MTTELTARPIRVVVVDDHPVVLEGTEAALIRAGDIQVVGAAGDGATALRLVREQRPDVLLLDVRLPDISGIAVARKVRATQPEVAVLVLTAYDDIGYQRALRKLGVAGYVLKSAKVEFLVAAVRAAAAGQTVTATSGRAWAVFERPEALTPREREVLRLLVAGRRNAQIAAALSVTVKTVEYHLTRVLAKLGVETRAAAVGIAYEQGLVLLDNDGVVEPE